MLSKMQYIHIQLYCFCKEKTFYEYYCSLVQAAKLKTWYTITTVNFA